MYSQLLQEEKIFPIMPRPEWSAFRAEICSEMLKKLSEKLGAKFPATTHGYSMVKFAHLNDAFLEVFFTASKPSRRPITAAKGKAKKKNSKIKKPKDIVHFLVQNSCPSQNVVKCDASGKKGTLLCCQCLLDQIEANLAEIQPENHQKCPKNAFLAKSSGSQWVKNLPESSKLMSCKTSQMHMWKSHNLYNRKMLMTFKV